MENEKWPSRTFDVAVVGAGVIGCSSSLFLTELGLQVALIEAGSIGLGTSNNSFAWINATSKTNDEPYHRLNALGAAGYRALSARWGEERIGVHPTGMLQWASPDDTVANRSLQGRFEQLRSFGYPVAMVEYDDLTAMEPHVQFAPGARGLHAIADAWLDVPAFVRFATEQVYSGGGTILENCSAESLLLDDDGKVEGVQTSCGTIRAKKVLVAAGPSTPEVLSALTGYAPYGSRFPMQQAPGLLVRTPPLKPWQFARHILYIAQADSFHVRPTPDGGLLLGADDTDGAALEPDDLAGLRQGATTLLKRAQLLMEKFPGPELLDTCELKIGVRPVPADGHSIAGSLPGSEDLYVALTHSGVTLGPAIGRLLASEIATGHRPHELATFGFDRFQSL